MTSTVQHINQKHPDLAFGNVSNAYKAWCPSRLRPYKRFLTSSNHVAARSTSEERLTDGLSTVSKTPGASKFQYISLLDQPGHYVVRPPAWATACVVNASAGGQGGWGADAFCGTDGVASPYIQSGAGGQAGQCAISRIIALDHKNENTTMTVQVGAGGVGGCRTYPPAPGGETIISYNGYKIVLRGGGAHGEEIANGSPSQLTTGSQGTPCGGRGGNSQLAAGGAGGAAGTSGDSNDASNGSNGSLGGGGGGGAAPYGACSACGGKGGDGVVILHFLRSFHHQNSNP